MNNSVKRYTLWSQSNDLKEMTKRVTWIKRKKKASYNFEKKLFIRVITFLNNHMIHRTLLKVTSWLTKGLILKSQKKTQPLERGLRGVGRVVHLRNNLLCAWYKRGLSSFSLPSENIHILCLFVFIARKEKFCQAKDCLLPRDWLCLSQEQKVWPWLLRKLAYKAHQTYWRCFCNFHFPFSTNQIMQR